MKTPKNQKEDIKKRLKALGSHRFTGVAAGLVVAIVGVTLIFQSHAATSSSAAEAESGTVGGNAASVADSAASGGYKVSFGAGSGGGGAGGGGSNPYIAPGISKGIINDASASSDADAADMKTLGVKWVRGWMSCGNANGIKAAVQRFKDNGATYLPSYNCDINTSIDDYKSKLKADMQVLMPLGIHVWEIGNEMDGGWTSENNYCNNNSTPGNMQCAERAYTPFLKAAYETIHATDPQGVVVYGGLSSYDVNLGPWMEAMLSNPDQPWNYMDGFGYHPYGNSVDESMASMDSVKSYMAKNATFANKPIWITEYGCWSSGLGSQQNSPCSPQNESGKSDYMKGMLDRLKAWNKGTSFEIRTPICWYILHEQGSDAAGYGLKSGDGTGGHLEAYDMYKNYQF